MKTLATLTMLSLAAAATGCTMLSAPVIPPLAVI